MARFTFGTIVDIISISYIEKKSYLNLQIRQKNFFAKFQKKH